MEDAASLRELIAHSVRVLESPDDSRDYAGFGRFEMTATLTGLRMYLARGYAEVEANSDSVAQRGFPTPW